MLCDHIHMPIGRHACSSSDAACVAGRFVIHECVVFKQVLLSSWPEEPTDKLVELVRLLPITPMTSPLNDHALGFSFSSGLAVHKLNNLHRPSSREAATPVACHDQYLCLTATRRAEIMRNRSSPVLRSVIRHQLAIPPSIALHRFSQEECLVVAPGI